MTIAPYRAVTNRRTHMVVESATGRFLGAFGSNYYRPWVFPLYTPSGQTVIQEFPFDHPFHTGGFVSQNPVVVGDRQANFWAMPPRRSADDALFQNVGRIDTAAGIDITPHEAGVRFRARCVWRDPEEQPIIDEIRTVDIFTTRDATLCDITSQKIAAYGTVKYPRTKFGSVGVRVEPRLLPPLGGTIIADGGRRGNADIVHEQDSQFVAYESAPGTDEAFGVALSILQPDVQGPWFVRDYGMAIYNPTWTSPVTTAEGGDWTVACRIVAYDGTLTDDRVRTWLEQGYARPDSPTASDS